MKLVLLTLTLLGYCAAIVVLLIRMRQTRLDQNPTPNKTSFWLFSLIALICHGLLLGKGILIQDGLNLGVFKALSLVGWMIVLLVWLSSLKKPMECLAIVLYPIAMITLLMDWFLISNHPVQFGGAWQLQAHIFVSMAALSFLSIAIVQSIVLVIQDRQLHNRHPGGLIQTLPPLQLMEKILFQLIGVGFILLTIGLLIGFLFISDLFGQRLVHKTVLASLAWCIFAVVIWGRWRFGWRGRRAIYFVLGGFITLLLAFVGTKIVIELILQPGA